MTEIKFTEAQKRALDTSCGKIVLAGAGSGKTTVLTERYLRLLQEKNADPDHIVAMTYTKKAASQLKAKINEKINKKISNDKQNSDFWTIKSKEMVWSRIGTIHSICARLIRNYPLLAGVDPEFVIDNNLQTAKQKEVSNYLKRAIYTKNDYLKKLLIKIKIDDIERLMLLLLKDSELQSCMKNILADKNAALSEMEKLGKFLLNLDIKHEFKNPVIGYFDETLDLITNLYLFAEPLLQNTNEAIRFLAFDDIEKRAWRLLKNREIAIEISKKIKFLMVDEFQDTSLLQWKIIQSLVLDEKGNFDADKLFLVGDEKQSIYGFRNANVTVIKTAQKEYQKFYKNLEQKELYSKVFINLNDNFRTNDYLIEPLNRAFEGLLESEGDSRMSYEAEPQALVARREYKRSYPGKVELALSFGESRLSTYRYIAAQILDAIDNMKITGANSEMRKVEYADMAILLRKRTHINELEEILNEFNIPYNSDTGKSLFEKQEILDIINLIAVFADKRDRIALAGLLRGPLFSLPDTILTLLFFDGSNAIRNWENFVNKPESHEEISLLEPEELKTLDKKWKLWQQLEKASHDYDIIRFLNFALEKSGAWAVYNSVADSRQKIENIKKFLDLIKSLVKDGNLSFLTLYNSIQQSKENTNNEDHEQAKIEPDKGVQILTIHKSKGLEFPFVIIPDLYDHQDIRSNVLNYGDILTQDSWLSPVISKDFYVLGKQKADERKKGKLSIYEWKNSVLSKAEEIAELKRLIYVAATRAKDHLLLVSTVKIKQNGDLTGIGKSPLHFWLKALNVKLAEDSIEQNSNIPGFSVIQIDDELVKSSLPNLKSQIISSEAEKGNKQSADKTSFIINRVKPKTELHLPVTAFCSYLANPKEYPLEKLLWLIENEQHDLFEQRTHSDSLLPSELKGLSSQIGDFVHNYLSLPTLQSRPLEKQIIQKFETYLDNNESLTLLIEHIRTLLHNHHKLIQPPSNAKHELGVKFNLNNCIFSGRIDLAWRESKTAYIVDYKTNAIAAENIKEVAESSGYIHQGKLYALALSSVWRTETTNTIFSFLYPGENLEINLQSSDKEYYSNCVEHVRKEMLAAK